MQFFYIKFIISFKIHVTLLNISPNLYCISFCLWPCLSFGKFLKMPRNPAGFLTFDVGPHQRGTILAWRPGHPTARWLKQRIQQGTSWTKVATCDIVGVPPIYLWGTARVDWRGKNGEQGFNFSKFKMFCEGRSRLVRYIIVRQWHKNCALCKLGISSRENNLWYLFWCHLLILLDLFSRLPA